MNAWNCLSCGKPLDVINKEQLCTDCFSHDFPQQQDQQKRSHIEDCFTQGKALGEIIQPLCMGYEVHKMLSIGFRFLGSPLTQVDVKGDEETRAFMMGIAAGVNTFRIGEDN